MLLFLWKLHTFTQFTIKGQRLLFPEIPGFFFSSKNKQNWNNNKSIERHIHVFLVLKSISKKLSVDSNPTYFLALHVYIYNADGHSQCLCSAMVIGIKKTNFSRYMMSFWWFAIAPKWPLTFKLRNHSRHLLFLFPIKVGYFYFRVIMLYNFSKQLPL